MLVLFREISCGVEFIITEKVLEKNSVFGNYIKNDNKIAIEKLNV